MLVIIYITALWLEATFEHLVVNYVLILKIKANIIVTI